MKYAEKIIGKFGGVRPAANALGLPPTTVQYWKEKGLIPAGRHAHVLETARAMKIDLTHSDFFDVPSEAA